LLMRKLWLGFHQLLQREYGTERIPNACVSIPDSRDEGEARGLPSTASKPFGTQ
jgi:hypothetical protein